MITVRHDAGVTFGTLAAEPATQELQGLT